MSFPQFDRSSGDDATHIANERNNRSDDDAVSHAPSHLTAAFQPRRAVTNRNSRIQIAEPPGSQQGSSEQYLPYTPLETSLAPQDHLSPDDGVELRRASDSSERTLCDQIEEEIQHSLKRVSLSSYQHPNDIVSPGNVYFSGDPPRPAVKRRLVNRQSLDDGDNPFHFRDEDDISPHDIDREAPPHRGVLSNLLEHSRVSNPTPKWDNYWASPSRSVSLSESGPDMRPRLSRLYSLGGYDADDPRITGATRELLDDPADLERNVKDQMSLRSMSYKQRRREAEKIKIRFFVTCTSRTLRRVA